MREWFLRQPEVKTKPGFSVSCPEHGLLEVVADFKAADLVIDAHREVCDKPITIRQVKGVIL